MRRCCFLCSKWSAIILSVSTRWKAFCGVSTCHHVRKQHEWSSGKPKERVFLRHTEAWEGKVMIIWYAFCGPPHYAHTLAHAVFLFHLLVAIIFPPQGSHCQFLPRLIIASLASPCNGPTLSNSEHWAWALPMTKDYIIDSSPSTTPLLCLPVSFLHFFLTGNNFLTVILCCFLPLCSHDLMQCKAEPLWVICSLPVVDTALFSSAWLQTQSAKDLWFLWSGGTTASLQTLSTSSECRFQCRWWSA